VKLVAYTDNADPGGADLGLAQLPRPFPLYDERVG
jgi:hypothetical protein